MGEKIRLPSSTGGIIQYFEEYKSKIRMSPMAVVILTIIVMIVILLLHVTNPFGF